ncbi:Asp-tRNA(Asn)/Glu-tRNA(Gln) amidotransferase subunit GatB [Salibacter sp.]|uniref:Asp-tRNA(Asn)/Glu-tRNA(Gln) amidotransferase subunit GatB n=1 Tax=Salibacter sp. TaxID=2010995 RepID=UPI0028701B58|nr:Asp-tRNA(Asn)/Glu-tRNA(Gln) amidotransferase subunit GatB [Salibacter sp.]MDR9397518.1 Asp-tRNA(Asn)/Glu-tRNA(Gln) amidotransferase subunit GatB [Salibacter sp.]MDR9486934.1 Asp-tRNA(Asn)/Glu-tRNA(Gln) amidotransferase subunit GatB [Salibacter sp.]
MKTINFASLFELTMYDKYEAVIGLEVHAQLKTKTKAFSSDPNAYGELPNHLVTPVSLGHPGTLPQFNEKSPEFAVKLGLACNSKITAENRFSRKNYFYADLPKGYQITQFDTPICTGGYIEIKLENNTKKINLTRIHMEEDSGKSIHDQDPFHTLIDLNRAGVPLLEIVTEPDIRSGEEAYQYLSEVRKLVRYLEICDGNMEEGSLRCDANISVRHKGSEEFGQKVEVKNMNSIRNVQRAIEHETKRQIEALENNEEIFHETRTFNAVDGTTTSMRSKEMDNDYRYFTEPDLLPLEITTEYIEKMKNELPPLPNELFKKYVEDFKLSDYDAGILTDSKEIALYFEEVVSNTKNFKAAANWVMVNVKSYLNENALHISDFPVSPKQIAELIQLIDDGKISHSVASQNLFPALTETSNKSPLELAKELDLIQDQNEDNIKEAIKRVIENNPDETERYRNGEKKLLGFFMGQLMKETRGKADPKKSNSLIREMLEL